jgi:hypothetical protein
LIKGTDNYYNIPSTLKHTYTTFGFGKKEPSYIRKNVCPSPDHYKIGRLYDDSKKHVVTKNSGRQIHFCSFGIPHKYYEKAVIGPLTQNQSDSGNKSPIKISHLKGDSSPGPGSYNMRSSLKN